MNHEPTASRMTRRETAAVLTVGLLLLAVLSPAVLSARETARQKGCMNNLKRLGLGLMNYEASYLLFPPGYVTGQVASRTAGGSGWMTSVLPFVEEQKLYEELYARRRGLPFPPKSGRFEKVFRTNVRTYRCPSDRGPATNAARGQFGISSYSGNAGHRPLNAGLPDLLTKNWPGSPAASTMVPRRVSDEKKASGKLPFSATGLFFCNSRLGIRDCIDGMSYTILAGERGSIGGSGIWGGLRSPQSFNDIFTDGSHASRPGTPGGFSSNHGSPNVLMADGTIRPMDRRIESRPVSARTEEMGLLQKLTCRNDRQKTEQEPSSGPWGASD